MAEQSDQKIIEDLDNLLDDDINESNQDMQSGENLDELGLGCGPLFFIKSVRYHPIHRSVW